MMPFVYAPEYDASFGPHVFPVKKYVLLRNRLLEAGVAPDEFFEPAPATWKELAQVHTKKYLDDLRKARTTVRTWASELPVKKEIIQFFILTAGGTILATRLALKHGWAIHISGGFHHAAADHAEGFCYVNDLAVAIRVLQREGTIVKAAVIDCDVHQGNGTARIFHHDSTVFTYSIHQYELYPMPKAESDRDVHLEIGTGDEEYLAHLERDVPEILDRFRPELVLLQAGADPYREDQLGSLALTIEGLRRRDRFLLEQCARRGIPVVATLGGGYARRVQDVVTIHYNLCQAALEIFGTSSSQGSEHP